MDIIDFFINLSLVYFTWNYFSKIFEFLAKEYNECFKSSYAYVTIEQTKKIFSYENITFNENEKFDISCLRKIMRTNIKVESVVLLSSKITRIPQGLTKIFPNMKRLRIHHSTLESLSKNDLAEYKNLEGLDIFDSQIKFLPGDLFEGFEKLELISFENNKLRVIEPNILDCLENLKFVDFSENTNYNVMYNSLFPVASTLQEVKDQLYGKYFTNFMSHPNVKNLALNNADDQNRSSDIHSYIQNDNFKDFKIEIDDKEFHVHKFLLAARSPTLAEMLLNNPDAKYMKLVDIPVQVFELIIKYIYTDEIYFDNTMNFLHVFAAASRLGLEKLKNFATLIIYNKLTAENAVDVLDLSIKYGQDGLRQKAMQEIIKKYPKIEFKDNWMNNIEIITKTINFYKKLERLEQNFLNGI